MRESQIVYQVGKFWVCDADNQYSVMVDGKYMSHTDSSYKKNGDGFLLAKTRVDYLVKRNHKTKVKAYRDDHQP